MTNFAVCRVCLAFSIKIHAITSVHYQDIFEKLTNQKLITNDGRPTSVCYICYSHLRRCIQFANMSQITDDILTDILHRYPELITNDGRPTSVCYICYSHLRRCIQFANMSQITDDILTDILHRYPELTEENVAFYSMGIKNKFLSTPVSTYILSPSNNSDVNGTKDFQGGFIVELSEVKVEQDLEEQEEGNIELNVKDKTSFSHQDTDDLEHVVSRIAQNIEKEHVNLEKQFIAEKEHVTINQEQALEVDTIENEQFILEKEQVTIKREHDDEVVQTEQDFLENGQFILEKEQVTIKQEQNEDSELTIEDDIIVNIDKKTMEKELIIVEKQFILEKEQVTIKREHDEDEQMVVQTEQDILENEQIVLKKEQVSIIQEQNEDSELTIEDDIIVIDRKTMEIEQVIVEKQFILEKEQGTLGINQFISELTQEVEDELDAFNNECTGVEDIQTKHQEDEIDYILIESDEEEQMPEQSILIEDDEEINEIQCNNNTLIGHKEEHDVRRVTASNQRRRRQSTRYTCRRCNKSFNKCSLFSKHKRTRLDCEICDGTFNSKSVLKKHAKKKRSETQNPVEFICDFCGNRFPRKSYLKWHLTNLHD